MKHVVADPRAPDGDERTWAAGRVQRGLAIARSEGGLDDLPADLAGREHARVHVDVREAIEDVVENRVRDRHAPAVGPRRSTRRDQADQDARRDAEPTGAMQVSNRDRRHQPGVRARDGDEVRVAVDRHGVRARARARCGGLRPVDVTDDQDLAEEGLPADLASPVHDRVHVDVGQTVEHTRDLRRGQSRGTFVRARGRAGRRQPEEHTRGPTRCRETVEVNAVDRRRETVERADDVHVARHVVHRDDGGTRGCRGDRRGLLGAVERGVKHVYVGLNGRSEKECEEE